MTMKASTAVSFKINGNVFTADTDYGPVKVTFEMTRDRDHDPDKLFASVSMDELTVNGITYHGYVHLTHDAPASFNGGWAYRGAYLRRADWREPTDKGRRALYDMAYALVAELYDNPDNQIELRAQVHTYAARATRLVDEVEALRKEITAKVTAREELDKLVNTLKEQIVWSRG